MREREEFTPMERQVIMTLQARGYLRANTTAANLTALHSLRDKGRVEWVEKERKWKLVTKKPTPVAAILASITALSDAQANLFWATLDTAMHDEWDCSLHTGLELFGVDELRVVTRTATLMAQHAEEHPDAT